MMELRLDKIWNAIPKGLGPIPAVLPRLASAKKIDFWALRVVDLKLKSHL